MKRTRLAIVTTLILASSAALAAPGDEFRPITQGIAARDAVPYSWGPLKAGGGWVALPPDVLSVTVNGVAHPLCVTADLGWAGIGHSRVSEGRTGIGCASYLSRNDGAYWFGTPSAVPNPMWINTGAQFPEPRGALLLKTQSGTRRKVFACRFNKVGVVYVGYIGDDGNCYGATASGLKESASTYLTLVSKGTGPDAKPRYGWVNAGPDYTPHAPSIAKVSLALNGVVTTRSVCRVRHSAENFRPGWVIDGRCNYFSYTDNTVKRWTDANYDVMRADPAAPKIPWVFRAPEGTAFYACTSTATVNGAVRDILFGFTSDRAACTDGIKATNTERRPSYVWSAPTIVELPNPDANAG